MKVKVGKKIYPMRKNEKMVIFNILYKGKQITTFGNLLGTHTIYFAKALDVEIKSE